MYEFASTNFLAKCLSTAMSMSMIRGNVSSKEIMHHSSAANESRPCKYKTKHLEYSGLHTVIAIHELLKH